jgi:hypothetical protein
MEAPASAPVHNASVRVGAGIQVTVSLQLHQVDKAEPTALSPLIFQ